MAHQSQHPSHWPLTLLGGMSSLLNLFLPVVLVRVFTPADVGVFKIFFLYLALVPEVFLGSGLLSGIALWSGRGNAGKRAITLSALILPVLGISAMVTVLLLQHTLAGAFAVDQSYLFIFALCAFSSLGGLFFEEALICSGRIWAGALFHSGTQLFRAMLLLAVALLTGDLASVFLAFAIYSFLKFALSYVVGFQMGLIGAEFSRQDLTSVVRYSFPVSFSGILSLVSEKADQFLLAAYLSTHQFAVYSLGCLAIPPLHILEQSVTRLLVPDLSRLDEERRFSDFAWRYRRAVSELSIVLIPSSVGLALFSDQIITLLFTSDYIEGALYLRIFAVSYLLLSFPFDVFARARGDGRWILHTYLSSGACALALTALGLEFFGASGALCAVISVQLCLRLWGLRYASKSTQLPFRRFVPLGDLSRYVLFSFLGAAIGWSTRFVFGEGLLYLLLGGVIFWLTYGVLLLCWKRSLPPHARSLCFVLQQIGVGGIERMALQHASELVRRGIGVSFFVYDHYGLAERENLIEEATSAGVQVEVFKKKEGFSPAVVKNLVRTLSRERIDVLHSHDLGSLLYASFAKVFCPHRIRLVHTQHSFVHLERSRWYPLYERFFTLFANELVVVSEEMRGRYREIGVSETRISVVANGIVVRDPFVHLPSSERKKLVLEDYSDSSLSVPPEGSLWILHLARLFPKKGQRQILQIWNSLPRDQQEGSHLFLVGPFANDQEKSVIDEAIRQSSLPDHIHLLPGTKFPDRWLAACDLFVSASEFEGNPLTPAEALALGSEVALSDIPGHEVYRQFVTMFPLHDLKNASDILSEKIRALQNGKNESAEFLVARSEYLASLSIEAMSDKYVNLYWPSSEVPSTGLSIRRLCQVVVIGALGRSTFLLSFITARR
ncbi:MAG: glycosyltransferase [Bdellovibrionales bacterium]|nr:glycosyltransferase [Bdellovibrionales bacterium]